MNHPGPQRIDRDALLARVDLEQLLDSLTTRASNRRAWRCIDPNHGDEHPSVTMTVDRTGTQRWRCWSGGHGGTAIDAVVVAKRLDVGAAIRWLNDHHAHLEPVVRPATPTRPPVGRPTPEVIEYVERAERLLWSGAGADIRNWLFARGLHEPVLRANRVGADPGRRYLPRRRGFPAGWPAAVFPALSVGGDVTYFQVRIIDPPHGRAKYDNPAGRWAANPHVTWTSSPDPTRANLIVLTEGVPDALVAAQAGFRTVGVLGAHLLPNQLPELLLQQISRTQQARVAVCFDADQTGTTASQALLKRLLDHGVPAIVSSPPHGLDLTEWAFESDTWTEAFQRMAALPATPVSPGAASMASGGQSARSHGVDLPNYA